MGEREIGSAVLPCGLQNHEVVLSAIVRGVVMNSERLPRKRRRCYGPYAGRH